MSTWKLNLTIFLTAILSTILIPFLGVDLSKGKNEPEKP